MLLGAQVMRVLVLAAALLAFCQTAMASTVNFSSSVFASNRTTTTVTVDGVGLTFWASSYLGDTFFPATGLKFGYQQMHALEAVATETIQILSLNGKTARLSASGHLLPFSILVENQIVRDGLEFPKYSYGTLDVSDSGIVITKGTRFTLDVDFASNNIGAETVLYNMGFEIYTPPPIPVPASGLLLLTGLLGAGLWKRRREMA